VLLRACNVSVSELCARGASTAREFVQLGFDAIDLVDDRQLLRDLVVRFGGDAVASAFVASVSDAIMVAGAVSEDELKIPPNDLLRLCTRNARAATAVLEQLVLHWSVCEAANCGIRLASPFARIDWRLLRECNVYLPNVPGIAITTICNDLDTTGMPVAERARVGLLTISSVTGPAN